MYADINFKTKKAFKEAIAAGKEVTVFQPGPFGGSATRNGKACVEGPHYPEPHRWYASVILKDGVVIQVDNVKKPEPQPMLAGILTVGAVLKHKAAQ